MGLPGADHVAEPEAASCQVEHVAVGADKGLACQLARTVRGDWQEGPVVLRNLQFAEIAVDAAAGGVQKASCAGHAHRLNHVVGQECALVEIDGRFHCCSGDVGVRRKVDHDVSAAHGLDQSV